MVYSEEALLSLTESVLGSGKRLNGSWEVLFHCPSCHHHKKKLSVNFSNGKWHCWVCENTNKTKGTSLFSLFKRFNASDFQKKELGKLLGKRKRRKKNILDKEEESFTSISLPTEYIPIWKNSGSIYRKHAFNYLIKRNISPIEMIKYRIGYCEDGKYRNRIIIPSFDDIGNLNFFTARSFYPDAVLKYLNPGVSKHKIITFELYINWDLPVILCESVFDAIAIKRNAVPLMGKTVSELLYRKLSSNKCSVIVYLDEDAQDNALKIVNQLSDNINDIRVATPPVGKDPGDLSLERNWNIINKAKKVNLQENLSDYLKLMIDKEY